MNIFAYKLLGISPRAFGMEIENCSLKAFFLEKKRTSFRAVACARRILPRGIVQAEQVLDPRKLAAEIKNLTASAQPKPIRNKCVIFSIPETKAFIRTIQIPRMSQDRK